MSGLGWGCCCWGGRDGVGVGSRDSAAVGERVGGA